MSVDLTTFILEIINFIVLMWLLQRFLYKPVLAVIAKRQQAIDDRVSEAEGKLREAEKLQKQYEERLAEWDKEKTDLLTALRAELQNERERQLNEIHQEIDNQRKRAAAVAERGSEDQIRKYEKAALDLAGQFTAKLLSQLASPELEGRIVDIFLNDLRNKISNGAPMGSSNGEAKTIDVRTAFPLSGNQRQEVENALKKALRSPCTFTFAVDGDLIAGIRVTEGGTIMQANLQDAASFFQDLDNHDS